jgi:hypothetical protein
MKPWHNGLGVGGLFIAGGVSLFLGADPAPKSKKPEPAAVASQPVAAPAKPAAATKMQPLNKQETVLLDLEGKRLLLKSQVCLRKGVLELLCCLKQSKEHEAIVSIDTKAYVVHAGLLALGAEQGAPVQFEPEFKPASGQRIDVFLSWTDAKGQPQRVPAQEWIRYVTARFYAEKLGKLPEEVKLTERLDEMRYDPKEGELIWYGQMTEETKQKYLAMTKDKAFRECIEKFFKRSQSRSMQANWVFSGSGYYIDEQTKEKFYRAEDGDLICVANFGSATLDVAAKSGNGAEELLFEAWTERIPELGTPIVIELIPVKADKAEGTGEAKSKKPTEKTTEKPTEKPTDAPMTDGKQTLGDPAEGKPEAPAKAAGKSGAKSAE